MIIDNRYSGPPRPLGYFVDLPPPVIRIPRERYIVEAQGAQPDDIDDALWAAPVDYIDRPYTLDEIRYTQPLRERMPRVDLDTVTFDTGSWEVTTDQVDRLAAVGQWIIEHATATHIVNTKSGHFDPSQFQDRYENALIDLLKKKEAGEKIEPAL